MASLNENLQIWNGSYNWSFQGEEWSDAWGGSEAQWFFSVYPRIHAFLPASNILEIATGYGRWTNYLKHHCDRLIGVDLASSCIDACRKRFESDPKLSFHVNDGSSLSMVENNSIDFVFSFDSLVHASPDVIQAYLAEIVLKLKPDGIGFIHHSNLGAFSQEMSYVNTIPDEMKKRILNDTFSGSDHFRDPLMTAVSFEQFCDSCGLQCISQELINWSTDGFLIDCFSVFTHKTSVWARPCQKIGNTDFMAEVRTIRMLSAIYSNTLLKEHQRSGPSGV